MTALATAAAALWHPFTVFLLLAVFVGMPVGAWLYDRSDRTTPEPDDRAEERQAQRERAAKASRRMAASPANLAVVPYVEPERAALLEQGRRLASERENLIAAGADPAELAVPIAPLPDVNDAGFWELPSGGDAA